MKKIHYFVFMLFPVLAHANGSVTWGGEQNEYYRFGNTDGGYISFFQFLSKDGIAHHNDTLIGVRSDYITKGRPGYDPGVYPDASKLPMVYMNNITIYANNQRWLSAKLSSRTNTAITGLPDGINITNINAETRYTGQYTKKIDIDIPNGIIVSEPTTGVAQSRIRIYKGEFGGPPYSIEGVCISSYSPVNYLNIVIEKDELLFTESEHTLAHVEYFIPRRHVIFEINFKTLKSELTMKPEVRIRLECGQNKHQPIIRHTKVRFYQGS